MVNSGNVKGISQVGNTVGDDGRRGNESDCFLFPCGHGLSRTECFIKAPNICSPPQGEKKTSKSGMLAGVLGKK